MANPFIHSKLFLGRRNEITRLRQFVARGESTLLLGGRRAGKTRLLEQLDDRDRLVVQTDAGAWTLEGEPSAIHALGKALGVVCSERDSLEATLRNISPVAILIDEADRMLGETWAAGFLAWLRYLIGPRGLGPQVAFVLAGGPVLGGYVNPNDGSPPLNLNERVYLRPLDRKACQTFIETGDVSIDVDILIRVAGGHPWILERILREMVDGEAFDDAVELAFEHCHESFPLWRRQLGEDGITVLEALPPKGLSRRAFIKDPNWIPHHPAMIRARHLCLIREDTVDGERGYCPGPALFLDWLRGAPEEPRYDLAISYASEDVAFAREIANGLRDEFKIFFAPDEDAYTWGQRLDRVLPNVYGNEINSRFVLVLSTESYVTKHWTLVEFEAARTRTGELLVVKMGALPPGMPPDIVYLDGTLDQFVKLLDVLRKKLRL